MIKEPIIMCIQGNPALVEELNADKEKLEYSFRIIDEFVRLYWQLLHWRENTWYMGIPTVKFPTDMWIYNEIIYETRPDILIETGTWFGGSALFFAHAFDAVGNGMVITIDTIRRNVPNHPRIQYLNGRSDDKIIIEKVKSQLNGAKVMVILDSEHHHEAVLKELEIYAPMVTTKQYLIIEDTISGGNPVNAYDVDGKIVTLGPIQAVRDYLINNPDFELDFSREKFLLTTNRMGYWRRK